ncbi:type II toxin-antitoxin system RelE family toxin [Streptomyces sp. NPDC001070]
MGPAASGESPTVHSRRAAPGRGRVPPPAPPRSGGCEGARGCRPGCGRGTASPDGARPWGSGYWRLSVGDWRVLYRPDAETVTVLVLKVGRGG